MLAFLLKFFPESPTTILILRLMQLLPVVLILYLINLLIRKKFQFDVFLYSFLVLGFNKWFIDKTSEVRPDILLLVFSLAGLNFWIQGLDRYKKIFLFYSGLFFGLAFTTSPKVSILLIALFISFIIHFKLGHVGKKITDLLPAFLYFFTGIIIPISVLIFYLLYNNGFEQFIECFYIGILKNPNYFSPASTLRHSIYINFAFWITGLMGMFLSLFNYLDNQFCGKKNSIYNITILSIIVIQYVIFHWFMPAPYPQSALIIFPLISIYCGLTLTKMEEYIRMKWRNYTKIVIFSFILILIFIPPYLSYLLDDKISHNKNHSQKEKINFILENTDADARIFDCQGFYMYRYPACYYGVLVKGTLLSIQQDVIKYDIISDLIKNNCMLAVPDYRWSMLPENVIRFFESNYVYIDKWNVLIPGKIIEFENSNVTEQFDPLPDYPYIITTYPPNKSILLDGIIVSTPTPFEKGNHVIAIHDNVEKVFILPEFSLKGDFDILNGNDLSKATLK